jgi:hypothetical protein
MDFYKLKTAVQTRPDLFIEVYPADDWPSIEKFEISESPYIICFDDGWLYEDVYFYLVDTVRDSTTNLRVEQVLFNLPQATRKFFIFNLDLLT